MTYATAPTPTDRLAGIIDALCRAVARRGGGRDRLAGPLVILIWRHLRRIAAQIVALAARIEAGRHRRYPARRPPRAAPRRHTPPALPHGPAWLLPLVPCEAAGHASQLRYLLAEPEMAALLDAAPQMRRLLRPLFRMLGVRPPPAPTAAPAPPPRPQAADRRPPADPPPPPLPAPRHPRPLRPLPPRPPLAHPRDRPAPGAA